jgi:uncharacterized SAM-binding protein YcdF (DUF218 family)
MYRLASHLLGPLSIALLAPLVAALIAAWRNPAHRRRLLALAAFLAIVIFASSRTGGSLLVRTLEGRYLPCDPHATADDTLVVLSGGMVLTGGRVEMAGDTALRCIHALALYRQAGHCRVVVCGGRPYEPPETPALAETMRRFLVDAGVSPADLVVEDQSMSTYENAANTAALLGDRNIHRIVLVTDAVHMLRASRCFEKAGFEVVPAPCRFQSGGLSGDPCDLLPSSDGVGRTEQAIHEWCGVLWYRLNGRI